MCAMEINQPQVGGSGVGGIASAPGELLLSDDTLKRLELPKEIQPNQILAFLKQQSRRLDDLQSRPAVKTASAAIPPPAEAFANIPDQVNMSPEELTALQELAAQTNQREAGGMGAQSEGADAAPPLEQTADSVLDQLRKKYGPVDVESDAVGGDIMDWFVSMEISKEASEVDEKWQATMQSIVKGGKVDAVTVLLLIGEYMTEKYGVGLKKSIRAFGDRVEAHEKFVAELNLGEGTELSATDMMKANQEQQAHMMDSQMAIQTIQSIKQAIDKFQNLTKSQVDAVHSGLKDILRNVRATG